MNIKYIIIFIFVLPIYTCVHIINNKIKIKEEIKKESINILLKKIKTDIKNINIKVAKIRIKQERAKARNYLVSDRDFTFNSFTYGQMKKFFKSYPNNKFTEKELKYIYSKIKEKKLSPILVATKFEQENSMTKNNFKHSIPYNKRLNRILGVGLYIKKRDPKTGKMYYPFWGFKNQIDNGFYTLRRFYDIWKKGYGIRLQQGQGYIVPVNAATYALYIYCPLYGKYDNCGFECIGNQLFIFLFYEFKNRWIKINGYY